MRLGSADARARFVQAHVIRLATVGSDSRPHLVPCTFAVDRSGRIVIGIDSKPKSSPNLRRLRNVAENPRVSLLADHYSADWAELWWARADGVAIVERSDAEHAEHAEHWRLLRAKYPQYAGQVVDGPVIAVRVTSWSGWSYSSFPSPHDGRA